MKPKIAKDTTVAAIPDQVWCQLESDAVILHLKNRTYYGLNGVGSAIWRELQTPKTVSSLVSVLVRDYEVAPQTCERDLLDLLRQMQSAGLIEVLDAEAA